MPSLASTRFLQRVLWADAVVVLAELQWLGMRRAPRVTGWA